MADSNDMQAAQYEIWNADRIIKSLNDEEASAAHHLCRSLSCLDPASGVNRRLQSAIAAERNLRELARMSMDLGQAYIDNALNLDAEADISVSLEKANLRLSWCYFMIGLSKAMDAYAQYVGGPAKLITEFKTPIVDTLKPMADQKRPQGQVDGLALAQTANGTMIALLQEFPESKALADLQKGLATTIEGVKDLAELWKKSGTLPNFWSADGKRFVVELLEGTAKLIDLANRVLTVYDMTPRYVPEVVKNAAPDRLRKLPAISKDRLDKLKAWISAIKYVLEAVASFLRSCLSLADYFESRKAAHEAGDLALKQLAQTGTPTLDPRAEIFANATRADLINLIHEANSAGDAHELAHAAIARIRELKGEIESLSGQYERQRHFLDWNGKRIAEFRAQLRESDRRLEKHRGSIAPLPETASFYDGGPVNRDQLLVRIDHARGRIARLIDPQPTWIYTRGRFGPRMGTM